MNKKIGTFPVNEVGLLLTGAMLGGCGVFFALLLLAPRDQGITKKAEAVFTVSEMERLHKLARRWHQAPAEQR